jgi:hypothetical protein
MPFNGGEEDDVLLDPDAVDAPVSELPLSSPPPAFQAPPGTDVKTAVETDEPEPLPEFDPRFRDDWEGLMYLGFLTKPLKFLGHTFTIKTLDVDTILEIGMLHAPYQGTIADLKAYQALLTAAAVTRVDGQPLAVPLGEDDRDLESRFMVVRKWYPASLDYLYTEYLNLEARVDEVIEAMRTGHLVGEVRSAADSTPGLSPASA